MFVQNVVSRKWKVVYSVEGELPPLTEIVSAESKATALLKFKGRFTEDDDLKICCIEEVME